MNEINGGIYEIVNLKTNKKYIGSSATLRKREYEHFYALRNNKHPNKYLQHSYNKHGEENFVFNVILLVEDVNELFLREQEYIDFYGIKNLYNLSPTAGSIRGYEFPESSLKLQSESKRNKIVSNSIKETIRQANYLQINNMKIPVLQINPLTDEVIKEWDSMSDAARFFNVKKYAIYKSCRSEKLRIRGFRWQYKDKNHTEKVPKYSSEKKKIKQIDIETKECICIFDSISKAAKAFNIDRKSILRAVRGDYRSSCGFFWEYA